MPQQAIALTEPGRLTAIPDNLPSPSPGEARVRIRTIGVCGTDIHAFHGRQPFFQYPRILGHELAAEIVELNGPSTLKPGQLVAVEPYLNDPTSPASKKGKTNCCENLQVLGVHCDGGMRPEINVPVHKLHAAQTATAEQLALVEMLSIGCHATHRSRAQESDTALILGAGPIGLSVLSFLRNITKDIIVADLSEDRLAFTREAFDVERTLLVNPEAKGWSEAFRPSQSNKPSQSQSNSPLLDACGGQLPDLVFDATGNPGSMHTTFDLVAHGGTILFVGLFQGEVTFHDPTFHRKEITLMSSRNATSGEIKKVIEAVESGAVDTQPWITHRLVSDEVPDLFEGTITDPELRKAVIEVR